MLEEQIEQAKEFTEDIRKYAHLRLKIRLIIYFILSVGMLGVAVYDIVADNAGIISSVVGVAVGIIVGFIVTRSFKISWDEDAQKVITQLDEYGAIILAVYIGLEIYREKLVEYFIHDSSAVSISFAVLTGIMIGRVLGIRRRFQKVLDNNI